jgi:hypothetical protein
MGIVLQDEQAKELVELTRENNRMLKDMRRSAFIGGILQFVWWVVVLVVIPYFTWIWLQPYIQNITGAYQDAQNKTAQASADFSQFQDFFKQFSGGGK